MKYDTHQLKLTEILFLLRMNFGKITKIRNVSALFSDDVVCYIGEIFMYEMCGVVARAQTLGGSQ